MVPTMRAISHHLRPSQETIHAMFRIPRLLLLVQQAPKLPSLLTAGLEATTRTNEVKIPPIKRTISDALQATVLWLVSMVRGRGL
jgi:hypothetical protein